MAAKEITMANGIARADILRDILTSHPLPIRAASASALPTIIRPPPYGNISTYSCSPEISISIINMPNGKFKARSPSGYHLIGLSDNPIIASWQSKQGEGEVTVPRGIILPPGINYEIKISGNSCLSLVQIKQQGSLPPSFVSPVKFSQKTITEIFSGTLDLECHIGTSGADQNFHLHRHSNKIYLGYAATDVIYMDNKELKFARVPTGGGIIINPNTLHYPILNPEASSFILTTPSHGPDEIAMSYQEIKKALAFQLKRP